LKAEPISFTEKQESYAHFIREKYSNAPHNDLLAHMHQMEKNGFRKSKQPLQSSDSTVNVKVENNLKKNSK
jgi:hypothetical protein